MTLSELSNLIYTVGENTTVCIFDDEDLWYDYRHGENNGSMLLKYETIYKAGYVLSEKFANAKVIGLFPASTDTIDVIIEREP